MSTYYVVAAVMPWSSIILVETGRPLRSDEQDSAGYMSVFTTRAAAEACARLSGSPVLEMESVAAADASQTTTAGHTGAERPEVATDRGNAE